MSRVCELAEHDEEDDETWDPRVALVGVHDLVAKERYEEGCGSNDQDTGPAWHFGVDGVKELSTDDDIDSGPSDAGKAVEDSD